MTLLFHTCAALAATLALAAGAAAQAFPAKPIRMIVGFPPGGVVDIVARTVAQPAGEILGQQIVVDARPGANGMIGAELITKAAPDGYTIGLVSISNMVLSVLLNPNAPYQTLRDFTPITNVGLVPFVVAVHPAVPARSLKDLIALAKKQPGRLNFGSPGVGGLQHLTIEMINSMAGIRIQHVPYKGTGPMMNDLLGGQVQMAISGAIGAIPHVKSGRLRGLAIGDSQRSPTLPDIPTIAESGVPGYQASIWTGMFAPRGTPRAIIERLNREVVRIVQQPDFRQRMNQMGSDTVGSSPEAWGKFIETEIVKWAKIAKIAGLKPE
jgi:tripartite-type tricarboxylate transporter receptor subunit TctC